MATFFFRYAEYKYVDTTEKANIKGYSDYGKIASYATDAFAWANKVGLISGDSATTLSPKKAATREQFSAILHRYDLAKEDMKYYLSCEYPVLKSSFTEEEYPLADNADIYVSTKGSDSGDGSFEHPFKTFERAKNEVRELKKTATDGIVVAFMAGDYGSLDITFTAEDGGSESVPVTYCKYGDGDVTFTNGITIPENSFTAISDSDKYLFKEKNCDSIKKVSLKGKIDEMGKDNILFSETSSCYEARYPNKNSDGTDEYFKNMTTTVDPYKSIELQGTILPRTVDGFRTVEGMKVTGFLRTGWLIDTFLVESYDKNTHILTFDFSYPFANQYSLEQFCLAYEGRMDDTVFFSNLSDQLDYEGEYWFNPDTKDLFVYKPKGDYSISTGEKFMNIENGAEYLNFVGLNFSTSTSIAILSNADNITFDGCTVKNVSGQSAIRCTGNNVTVKNSEFSNFLVCGIIMNGRTSYKTLESCGGIIDNNYFHDFTLPESFAEAVKIDGIGIKVSHNEFKNGGHGAITFNGIDNIIEYNYFENMMSTTQDFGAVYTWESVSTRSNIIRYNLFGQMDTGSKYAIYLDNNTCGQEVYGNLFFNGGNCNIVINGGRDNYIHDNVVICTDGVRSYVSSNNGIYSYILKDNLEGLKTAEIWSYFPGRRPAEGTEGYELWHDRWPIMYDYYFDTVNLDDVNCFFNLVNYYKNNAVFGMEVDYGENKFGNAENDKEFSLDENTFFLDPTHGDYTITEDNGFFDNNYIYDFSKIGRY